MQKSVQILEKILYRTANQHSHTKYYQALKQLHTLCKSDAPDYHKIVERAELAYLQLQRHLLMPAYFMPFAVVCCSLVSHIRHCSLAVLSQSEVPELDQRVVEMDYEIIPRSDTLPNRSTTPSQAKTHIQNASQKDKISRPRSPSRTPEKKKRRKNEIDNLFDML